LSFIQEFNAANRKQPNLREDDTCNGHEYSQQGTRIMVDDGCFEDGRTGWGLIIMVDDCHALMSNLGNVSGEI
jgi:hypothetical protein